MKAFVEYRRLEADGQRVHGLLKLWRHDDWDVVAVFYLTLEEFRQMKHLDLKEIEVEEREVGPATVFGA